MPFTTTTLKKFFILTLLFSFVPTCKAPFDEEDEEALSPVVVSAELKDPTITLTPARFSDTIYNHLGEETEPHIKDFDKRALAYAFMNKQLAHILSRPDFKKTSPLLAHFNTAKKALAKLNLGPYENMHPDDRHVINGLVALHFLIALDHSQKPDQTEMLKQCLATVESLEQGFFDSWWIHDPCEPKYEDWELFCIFLQNPTPETLEAVA